MKNGKRNPLIFGRWGGIRRNLLWEELVGNMEEEHIPKQSNGALIRERKRPTQRLRKVCFIYFGLIYSLTQKLFVGTIHQGV
jgi:hypothetical protein